MMSLTLQQTLQPRRESPWATAWNMSGSPLSKDQSISDIDSALKADFTVCWTASVVWVRRHLTTSLSSWRAVNKAGVVLADDLDAIIDDLTDPCFVGEKKFNFDLEILEHAGKGVDISWDSDLA